MAHWSRWFGFRLLGLLGLLLPLTVPQASWAANGIRAWYGAGSGRASEQAFRLIVAKSDLQVVVLDDFQYAQRYRYRGVWLASLLGELARKLKRVDMAILHFSNDVRIPLPLRGASRPPAFLALGLWSEADQRWQTKFPRIERPHPYFRDLRPVRFSGNKVVVKTGVHPHVKGTVAKSFSPWSHAASLTGVELVRGASYYALYWRGRTAQSRAGFAVFKQSCIFCHTVRGIGAQLGGDFAHLGQRWTQVPPLRKPGETDSLHHQTHKSLGEHIRYAGPDDPAHGLYMPPIKLTDAQVVALWHFLRSVEVEPKPRLPEDPDRP